MSPWGHQPPVSSGPTVSSCPTARCDRGRSAACHPQAGSGDPGCGRDHPRYPPVNFCHILHSQQAPEPGAGSPVAQIHSGCVRRGGREGRQGRAGPWAALRGLGPGCGCRAAEGGGHRGPCGPRAQRSPGGARGPHGPTAAVEREEVGVRCVHGAGGETRHSLGLQQGRREGRTQHIPRSVSPAWPWQCWVLIPPAPGHRRTRGGREGRKGREGKGQTGLGQDRAELHPPVMGSARGAAQFSPAVSFPVSHRVLPCVPSGSRSAQPRPCTPSGDGDRGAGPPG